jgi:site-specific DNA-methyltransferase (adenine-specific)
VTVPYYADDMVTLYLGDCRDVTAWLEADVLVTDPPYGRGWRQGTAWTNADGGGGHRSSGNATSIIGDRDTTARDEALRLWGDRLAVVFGDLLIPPPERAVQVLIYAKPVDAGIRAARAGRRRDVEGVYLLGDWPCGIGGASSVLRTSGRVAGPRGMALRAGHPHAKPLDVMQDLIALADGVVADPFAGSGTTLLAARAQGRKAIGVEIEERYCELIASRLSQGDLFGGVA